MDTAADRSRDGTGRTHSRRTRWMLAVALIVVGTCAAAILVSRARYDEWPWSAHPGTLHACGRDFIDQGRQSGVQIEAQGNHLVHIGSVPGWLNHGELWTTTSGTALSRGPCHVVMWVRTGEDRFETYTLSGGP